MMAVPAGDAAYALPDVPGRSSGWASFARALSSFTKRVSDLGRRAWYRVPTRLKMPCKVVSVVFLLLVLTLGEVLIWELTFAFGCHYPSTAMEHMYASSAREGMVSAAEMQDDGREKGFTGEVDWKLQQKDSGKEFGREISRIVVIGDPQLTDGHSYLHIKRGSWLEKITLHYCDVYMRRSFQNVQVRI